MRDSPILQVKLRPPHLPNDLLGRGRLLLALSKHARRKLLLVVAPAGYGKSTMLAMWLASVRQRSNRNLARSGRILSGSAWLTLEASDDQPHRFMAYLLAALRTAEPALGSQTEALLDAGQLDAATLLTPLLNEIGEVGPLTLVMDDFHLISHPLILNLVSFLLDHSTPNLILAISARVEPALPLVRLRARRSIFEIRAEDLRLTSHETLQFVRLVAGLPLSETAVATLHASTEGWLVGLQLATLALQREPATGTGEKALEAIVEVFDGSDENIVNYFTQEVLSGEREAIRSFILTSSVVEQIHPGLLDTIRGAEDSGRLIDELLDRKIFLFPVDSETHWYRFHILLRQALEAQLAQSIPAEEVAKLHHRASDWYRDNGDIEAALRHLLAAGKPELAAELLAEQAPAAWLAGDLARLSDWLAYLPERVVADLPQLCLFRAWICTTEGDYKESANWLGKAEEGYNPACADRRLRWMMMACPPLLRFQHDQEPFLARAASVMALADLPTDPNPWTIVALLTLGYSALALGDAEGSGIALLEAVERAETLKSDYLIYLAYRGWLIKHLRQAQLDQTLETAARLERAAVHSRFQLRLLAEAAFARGEVALERMYLPAAGDYFERTLELSRQIGNKTLEVTCLTRQAWVQELNGRPEAAMDAMNAAWRLIGERKSDPESMKIVEAHRAGLALRLGSAAIVEAWQARRDLSINIKRAALTEAGPVEQLTFAHTDLLHGGQGAERALTLLVDLEGVVSAEVDGRMFVEIPALMALAYHTLDKEDAFVSLQRALERGAPQKMKRVFVILGAPMQDLLQLYVLRDPHHPYATEVLAVFAGLPGTLQGGGLPIQLSERECQVLRLAAEGLSNQQIADTLVVSVNTIKTHLKRIYDKLDVGNRIAAIARARELALL